MGVGRPPWPRALVQTGCALRDGHRLIRIETTFPAGERGACAEALRYDMGPGCLRVIRQLTKVGRGRVKRHFGFERACQWDGRITS